jgi:hypothetical protein
VSIPGLLKGFAYDALDAGVIARFYFSFSNITSQGVVPDNANTQARNNFSQRTNSNFGKFAINTSFNNKDIFKQISLDVLAGGDQ